MRFVILRYEAILNYGFHSERIKIASCLARTTICVMGILHFAHSLPSGFSRRLKKRIANSTRGFLCASSVWERSNPTTVGFIANALRLLAYFARTTVCVEYFAICLFIAVRLQPTDKKRNCKLNSRFLCASSFWERSNPTTMSFIANALRLLRASQGRPFVSDILQFAYSLPSGFSRRIKNKTRAIIYNPGFDVFGKKGFSFSALFFQLKLCFSLISISAKPAVVTGITRFAAHVSITATSFATTATFRLCLWLTFNLVFGQHTFPG